MDGDNEVEEGFNNEEVEEEGQNSPASGLGFGGSLRYAAGSSREQVGPNLRDESNRWMEDDGLGLQRSWGGVAMDGEMNFMSTRWQGLCMNSQSIGVGVNVDFMSRAIGEESGDFMPRAIASQSAATGHGDCLSLPAGFGMC
jgi:hypothetical protein